MKINYSIVVLVLMMILAGCQADLPDPILGDIAPIVNLPGDIVDQESVLQNVTGIGESLQGVIDNSTNSSNVLANAFATEVEEFQTILDQVLFVSRIPPNAITSEEPLSGTSPSGDFVVYSYSLFTMQNGAGETTYIQYQIEEGVNEFIHTILSGTTENPTNKTVAGTTRVGLDSANLSLNFGSPLELGWTNASGLDVFTTTEGSSSTAMTILSGNAIKIAESSGGSVQTQSEWNTNWGGLFDGQLVLDAFQELQLWNDLTYVSTVSSNVDALVKPSIDDNYTSVVTALQPAFDISSNAVVSDGTIGSLPALSLTYSKDEKSYVYNYAVGDTARYHQVMIDDVLSYSAVETLDGSSTDLYDYSQASGDTENDHFRRFRRNVNGDNIKTVISTPIQWNQPLMNMYAILEYSSTDLSGSFFYRTSPSATYESGSANFTNSWWMVSFWTANGATGEYWTKDVFSFPGGRWNGTGVIEGREYSVFGTW